MSLKRCDQLGLELVDLDVELAQATLARTARNRRMAQACYLWAFSALRPSPGARRFYDRQRAKGKTHHQALRALANRLVGVLHGCLSNGQSYDEHVAWPTPKEAAA